MNDRMRALLLAEIGRLAVVDIPRPALERPDDVLVRVRAVGVCGSDLHGYLGHTGRRIPPLVMGHEAVGDVVAVGPGVRGLSPGSRVATHTVAACGRCAQCLAGARSLCVDRRILGMSAPGAYAEFVAWPEASLTELPSSLSFEHGALAEPLAIALHAVGLARIRPGDSVFVAGAGPIGVLVLALVRLAGARRILVSDVHSTRRDLAVVLGADVVIDATEQDPVQIAREQTGGSGVDVAFEAVGAAVTAGQTTEAVRNGGTVVWLGNNADRIEIGMQTIVTRNLCVRGAYGQTIEEFERALALLAGGAIPADTIVNKRAHLEEGPDLFDELLAEPAVLKCVIVP